MTSESNRKRIAIYGRVSTDEQAREGISLDEQRERLRAYCRAIGWTGDISEYIDDGYSAKNMERPALQQLLHDVGEHSVSKLVVTKLDRLSRRLIDLLQLIELVTKHNVSFTSTTESFDTDTPSGRLTLQVLGAVAEFERERIRERVVENMRYAARGGKWLTQHPYGYRIEDKELVVYEPEARHVRRIFSLYLNDGLGYFAIAKRLNEEGLPSRNNKEWSIRAIKLLLTNPVYVGTLVWNRIDSSKSHRTLKAQDEWVIIPHAHPAVIGEEMWDQVQARIHQKAAPPARAATSPHLLGGVLRCGKCGSTMTIGWSGNPKRIRIYRCSGYSNKGTCESKPYRAEKLEALFIDALSQLASSVDLEQPCICLHQVRSKPTNHVQRRVDNAKARYQRQVEAYTAGLIELAQLKLEKAALDKVVAEIQMVDPPSTQVDLETFASEFRQQAFGVRDAILSLPVPEAKAKIRTIVDQVIVHGSEDMEIVLRK